MSFADESFDYIVASLILSMVPNENKCFEEMIRVLKKDGRILIFDKFAPKNQKLTLTNVEPNKNTPPIICTRVICSCNIIAEINIATKGST